MLSRSYSYTAPSPARRRSVSLSRSSSFLISPSVTLYRSTSSVFSSSPRSYLPASFYRPNVMVSYGVQNSVPKYTDRYPYVRYSGWDVNPGMEIISRSSDYTRNHYTQSYKPVRQYLDNTLSMYQTNVHIRNSYKPSPIHYRPPTRSYIKYMNVDDAVNMYKNRYMTSGALVKYWLTPSRSDIRRRRDLGSSYFARTYTVPSYRMDFGYRLSRY
ncbi:unnamed protein product [Soboliphyme baturini]|uniref:Uncharacterized protein n=1 Tax=Soboliphyme baturini TaxID=241478 RepID=A0A183J2U3_9BILA|nr:unnamed protein product [Soboliphyme baturini]